MYIRPGVKVVHQFEISGRRIHSPARTLALMRSRQSLPSSFLSMNSKPRWTPLSHYWPRHDARNPSRPRPLQGCCEAALFYLAHDGHTIPRLNFRRPKLRQRQLRQNGHVFEPFSGTMPGNINGQTRSPSVIFDLPSPAKPCIAPY